MATIPNPSKTQDLEIKDAQLIFNSVWQQLELQHGRENLRFPKELIWLNGAPGSGKGTQTQFIMNFRDLTDGPVVVSDLLTSSEAQQMKDAGNMVGDAEVLTLVFNELLKPRYESGTVVDGFPRTKVQVECLKLLYQKLRGLRAQFYHTDLQEFFPKSIFHITVLFVDERESVARQIRRGRQTREHNEKVRASGVGKLKEERLTDFDENTARRRYRTFKEGTYEAFKDLRQIFHYHYINAHGSIEEVKERIVGEMRYQSSLELDERTFDRLRSIPISEEIVRHARQDLVKRLDDYAEHHEELFAGMCEHINEKFMPIIIRHAISGMALINSEDPRFHDPLALQILLDIFSERGYHTSIDIKKKNIPAKVNLETGEIELLKKRIYSFRVRFEGSEIRRG
ncbi:nucleoside monophosphate kinase [Opitutia bacterium ISCC 51]|nr:nucleoside monophosphate kinase [Opitutae bacterium ISCC 51]QXD26447.1 nucleoside monophosphate kinase [Opitutae bacterium ISCC 52]